MVNLTERIEQEKAFRSHAPGYWNGIGAELWNDWKWQLKNRVTTLPQLQKYLSLSEEERARLRDSALVIRRLGARRTTWPIRVGRIPICRSRDWCIGIPTVCYFW